MSGAVPPFPQYAFMAWYSGGAQGQSDSYVAFMVLKYDRLHFYAFSARIAKWGYGLCSHISLPESIERIWIGFHIRYLY